MKVLHLVYDCVPGTFRGGVQKMVAELATAQATQGDVVEVWTIGRDRCRVLGPRVLIRYFPGSVRWGARELRNELIARFREFAVIHAHNTYLPLNRYAAMVARRGAKVFFHSHGAVDPKFLRGWTVKALKKRLYIRFFERRNYDTACGVFGLTREECRQLELIGTRAAIYEVPNGIAVQPALPGVATDAFRAQHRIARDQPVILFLGRITHKKGLHHLVEAMLLVQRKRPDALLVICGDREQERDYVATLDKQITRLRLDRAVRWVGFLDEEAKRAAVGVGAMFVHPSYSEGMAMAVLESMSFGMPTIVTPGCYMEAAAEAGALRLVQQRAENIASVILELLDSPARAAELGTAARAYVTVHHAWPVLAERLKKIYAGSPEVLPFRVAREG